MTLDPHPTRITDRPPGPHRRYGVDIRQPRVQRELVPSDAWNSWFCFICAAIVLIASAWAIWESVR